MMNKLKLTFGLLAMIFFTSNIFGQDPVDYSVRVSNVSSIEGGFLGPCYDNGENEYRYNVSARDNVNTNPSSVNCIECNVDVNCDLDLSTVYRTQSSSSATSITINLEAWEDDIDNNCDFETGFFDDDDCHCDNEDVATINFRNGTEGQWVEYGPFTCGQHSVTVEILYDVLTPAPVDLVYFNGEANKASNTLKWTTASEENSEYFEIQRSKNGRDWQALTQVAAKGFSDQAVDYSFEDFNFLKETYYRLRMVDFDGTQEYSEIIVIKNEHVNEIEMISGIYPNPSKDIFTIQFSEISNDEEMEMIITDALGKLIYSYNVNANQMNDYSYRVDLGNEASGLYFLTVQTTSGLITSKKLFKQNTKR